MSLVKRDDIHLFNEDWEFEERVGLRSWDQVAGNQGYEAPMAEQLGGLSIFRIPSSCTYFTVL